MSEAIARRTVAAYCIHRPSRVGPTVPSFAPGILTVTGNGGFGRYGRYHRHMHFEPFLLDEWLDRFPSPKFNLASSTGPVWTLDELLELEDESLPKLLSTRL